MNYQTTLNLIETGIYRNESEDPSAFTDAYFARPNEIKELLVKESLNFVEAFSCEGIAAFLFDKVELIKSNQKAWENFLDLSFRTANEPEIIGSGEHTVFIMRKSE